MQSFDGVLKCTAHYTRSAVAYGVKVDHVRPAKLGDVPAMDAIRTALQSKPYKMIHVTQVDTSTGVLTDVRGIAELTKQVSPDTLVVVDGVCSIAGEELRMDGWGVDAAITGSQKALGVPSGLLVTMFGPRAMVFIAVFTAKCFIISMS